MSTLYNVAVSFISGDDSLNVFCFRFLSEFMDHLESIWATESLLFHTEFSQMKHVIGKYAPLSDHMKSLDIIHDVAVPSQLPVSCLFDGLVTEIESHRNECVCIESLLDEIFKSATAIHKKYIEAGSPLEINIDWTLRRDICEIFDKIVGLRKMDSDTLFQEILLKFSECENQIAIMLRGSFMGYQTYQSSEMKIAINEIHLREPSTDSSTVSVDCNNGIHI